MVPAISYSIAHLGSQIQMRKQRLVTGDLNATSGHRPYIFSAKPPPSFLIPNSSFLISHSSFAQSFHSESVDEAAPRADPPRKEPRHGSLTVPHQYGHHPLPAGAFFLYQPATGKLRTSRDLPKIRKGEEDPDARP